MHFLSEQRDVVVIGAGLAGLASAIVLAREGFSVTLFEQERLPRHRVCGEYVSRETLPFLARLGVDPHALGAKPLTQFELSSMQGRHFCCALDLGGFGLSRYRLDHALCRVAEAAGVNLQLETPVKQVTTLGDLYLVSAGGSQTRTRLVLGCFGKRSRLDHTLKRPHARRRSPYVGVKRHFRGPFPPNLVGLHTVPGGYCGISRVEDELINVCYLTHKRALEINGGVGHFEARGLRANPLLAAYLDRLTAVFARPIVISQVDFARKDPVQDHVLMLGDAAGLIHPLAGNGMAMALRSAALIAPLAARFLRGGLTRSQLESDHAEMWRREFRTRRYVSWGLQNVFESATLSETLCRSATALPALARLVIRSTHGSTF